jgi:CRP-like cAMP-binding protein
MAQSIWCLQRCELLASLSAAELALLERHATTRTFQRSELIYFPGERGQTVLVLARGQVRLKDVTPDGRQTILAFIAEGELFGELALFDEGSRGEFAEAAVDSQVIAIPSQDLLEVLKLRPALALGITKLVGLRRRRVENRLRNVLFRSNRERVAHILLELLQTHGRRQGIEWHYTIGLSHQDLANLIGITRESVTLVLGQLQLEKLVRVRRRAIVVLDSQRLSAETNRTQPQSICDSLGTTTRPAGENLKNVV